MSQKKSASRSKGDRDWKRCLDLHYVRWKKPRVLVVKSYSHCKDSILLKDTRDKTGDYMTEICFFLTCYFSKF